MSDLRGNAAYAPKGVISDIAAIGREPDIQPKNHKKENRYKMSTTDTMPEAGENGLVDPMSAISDAVLNGANLLESWADRISAEVDKAVAWDDKLNPAMLPIRLLIANLGKTTSGAIMDSPVIPDIQAALGELGSKASFKSFVTQAANLVELLTPSQIDLDVPDDVNKAVSDIRGILDNTIMSMVLAPSAAEAAKAAITKFQTARVKLDTWSKRSTRVVPSQTGTKGPNGNDSDKKVSVVFVTEDDLFPYSTRQGAQGISYVGHAIKEKVAESRNLLDPDGKPDVNQLPEDDKTAIMNALRDLADGTQKVQLPSIGTFTRK